MSGVAVGRVFNTLLVSSQDFFEHFSRNVVPGVEILQDAGSVAGGFSGAGTKESAGGWFFPRDAECGQVTNPSPEHRVDAWRES